MCPWESSKKSRPPKAGLFWNRTPTVLELETGHEALTRIQEILDRDGRIIALREKAFKTLGKPGLESRKVRHPAQGGARKFREEFEAVLEVGC